MFYCSFIVFIILLIVQISTAIKSGAVFLHIILNAINYENSRKKIMKSTRELCTDSMGAERPTAEDAETRASWAGATQLGHLPTVTLAWAAVWLGLPNAGWGFAGRTEAGPWPRGPDWVGGQGGQLPTGVAAAAAVAVTNTLEVKTFTLSFSSTSDT